MMNEYRQLQRLCEQQAALTATPEARTALEEMAAEYAQRAEHLERLQCLSGTARQVRS
jgi:hypothetical protein